MSALRAALAQKEEPVQEQRCRAEPRSDGDFVCDCKIGECPGRSTAPPKAEPVQEPVAKCIDDICSEHLGRVEAFDHLPRGTLLYAAPPRCPNCASLEAQNTELDRKLAEMEQAEPVHVARNAAAELRRLSAENKLLHERHHDDNVEYTRVLAQRDALLEVLKEVVPLLEEVLEITDDPEPGSIGHKARAAIKAVEEGK